MKITANQFANQLSLRINQRETEDLTLTKCHDQELHNVAMLEEFLIEI
jgi:hypothetical protein